MRNSVRNRNASHPMTAEQVSKLKYEFSNIEASKESFEEICGEIRLRSAIEFLSISILTARHDIKKVLKDNAVGNIDIERLLDQIGMAVDIMSFLTNIHDEVRVLRLYIENVKDLLNQQDTKGGNDHGN